MAKSNFLPSSPFLKPNFDSLTLFVPFVSSFEYLPFVLFFFFFPRRHWIRILFYKENEGIGMIAVFTLKSGTALWSQLNSLPIQFITNSFVRKIEKVNCRYKNKISFDFIPSLRLFRLPAQPLTLCQLRDDVRLFLVGLRHFLLPLRSRPVRLSLLIGYFLITGKQICCMKTLMGCYLFTAKAEMPL